MIRAPAIQKFWPTTQSLDLVRGSVDLVATGIEAEVRRFAAGARIEAGWRRFADISEALSSCMEYTNIPTMFIVFPTNSPWSVIWNNSFLCDGYDSLCWCLTKNHGLTTLHWASHDESTTFQPGTSFIYRTIHDGTVCERSVSCTQEDARWLFTQSGVSLPEENVSLYGAKRKRDRLNEAEMVQLLGRFGARPWDESFYCLPKQDCFVLHRTEFPSSVVRRSPGEVIYAV